MSLRERLQRIPFEPFLGLLLLTIVVASLWPAKGAASTAIGTIATAAIALLFFLHGARLPRESLLQAFGHWRLHGTILSLTFIVLPLVSVSLALLLPNLLPTNLWTGVLFLSALPSTVQSAIAFSSMARGNIAASVASAAASNLLGIAMTPLLMGLLTRTHSDAVSFAGVWKIVLQLLLPFALGHLCRPLIGDWAQRRKKLLQFTDRGTIVLAVYSAFSAAVVAGIWHQVSAKSLVVMICLCLALLAFMIVLSIYVARRAGFSREDEISVVMAGTQKSLVTGVPMARVLFSPADVGAAILPVMMYHQAQLLACTWLARRYARRTSAAAA